MRTASIVGFVGVALVGAGIWVAISGSGPCTPPACDSDTVGEPCRQTCNGPETYTCSATFQCGDPAPCDATTNCPFKPCYTRSCLGLNQCGQPGLYVCDTEKCCFYEPVDLNDPCPLPDEDPNALPWSGTCNAQQECTGP